MKITEIECPCCGYRLQEDEEENSGKFNSAIPTRYASVIGDEIPCTYELKVCNNCGTCFMHHEARIENLGFTNTQIKQREPCEHHQSTARTIAKLVRDENRNAKVCTSSWKDSSLKHHIEEQLENTKPINEAANILLCTRYIEHLQTAEDISAHAENLLVGDYLYIEMLDFNRLSRDGDQSFFWCERTWYPTPELVEGVFKRQGFKTIKESNVLNIGEPFWWKLMIKQGNQEYYNRKNNETDQGENLRERFLNMTRWVKYKVGSAKSISCYGMNHKMFMLVDIILREGICSTETINLYDSDLDKIGTYWNKIKIESIHKERDIKTTNDVHIFAFDASKNSPLLTANILGCKKNARIAHINDFLKQSTKKNQ